MWLQDKGAEKDAVTLCLFVLGFASPALAYCFKKTKMRTRLRKFPFRIPVTPQEYTTVVRPGQGTQILTLTNKESRHPFQHPYLKATSLD